MPRRPPTFDEFVGHQTIVSVIRRHVQGSRLKGTPFPNMLVRGDPGLGKSVMVRATANALGYHAVCVPNPRGLTEDALYNLITELDEGCLLFLEEAHALSPDTVTMLLGASGDDRLIPKRVFGGRRSDRGRVVPGETVSVGSFTLALGTDRATKIDAALLSRMKLKIRLTLYPLDEMREIGRRVCSHENVRVSSHGITLLALAARGNPRELEHLICLLGTYYPSATSEITKVDVRRFLQDHGIDRFMLSEIERLYLTALLHGPQRPEHLAIILGLRHDKTEMKERIEAFLMRAGLVTIGPDGRLSPRRGTRSPRVSPPRKRARPKRRSARSPGCGL